MVDQPGQLTPETNLVCWCLLNNPTEAPNSKQSKAPLAEQAFEFKFLLPQIFNPMVHNEYDWWTTRSD
jgi:hypothetical protein